MKAYGEKFSDEEVREMMTSAVDVDGKVSGRLIAIRSQFSVHPA